MKLTGKCLEDFEIWFIPKKITGILRLWDKERENETIENALIIEFFDSLKIYILIEKEFLENKWRFWICGAETSEQNYSSRKSAINEAIKIINRIYNVAY